VSAVPSAEGRLLGLGAIDQLSFAVPSVDAALPRYQSMFGGAFTAIDVADMEVVVRGRPATVSLRLGFGKTAGLEVELVEVVSGDWPTVSWLAEHGEGLHHLLYPVDDFPARVDAVQAAGGTLIMEGHNHGVSFGYLEVPMLNGMVVELIQMP
jgi:catechol 2,3-dioxygenase-like lactoylglutathione lyase family enzyme